MTNASVSLAAPSAPRQVSPVSTVALFLAALAFQVDCSELVAIHRARAAAQASLGAMLARTEAVQAGVPHLPLGVFLNLQVRLKSSHDSLGRVWRGGTRVGGRGGRARGAWKGPRSSWSPCVRGTPRTAHSGQPPAV